MKDLKAIRFILGTKISHDYQGKNVNTFSYLELCKQRVEAIGIPAKQNGLLIFDIDVPGESHRFDGREWWQNFTQEYGVPETYTVRTPSGGYHYYFQVPESINPDMFHPPGRLAPGVDVKYNGWVGAPPTVGYSIERGNVSTIAVMTPAMMVYLKSTHKENSRFEIDGNTAVFDLHRPFSNDQINLLRKKLEWVQTNGTLSYHEWRDGLFSLKSGVTDLDTLEEFYNKWTYNKSYRPGDEATARALVERANPHGGIGPGTIFNIIRNIEMREGAPTLETPWTPQEIIDRSKVEISFNRDGSPRIETSESNAAALIGAIFDENDLYYDERNNHYVFKNKSFSDVDLVNMLIPMLQSRTTGLGLEKFRKSVVSVGLDILMQQRRVDPHKKYLESLAWDGVPRIENFFQKYAGVLDSDYIRLVGKNLWTSLAARGLTPGCKFDNMIVIEGKEGIRKSSLVEAIGGKYTFAPFNAKAFQSLDDLRQMHQSTVVELPELLGLINQPAEQVKAFLSKPFDDIRDLYARKAMKRNRGFIFIGTTNSSKYLAQDMGMRRFWPVRIEGNTHIDLTGINMDRDQLFAEGIHYYKEGHAYYYMPEHLLTDVVKNKIITEPLVEPISNTVKSFGDSWTTFEVYKSLEGSGVIPRGFNQTMVSRIENAFTMLGYIKNIQNRWHTRNISLGDFI